MNSLVLEVLSTLIKIDCKKILHQHRMCLILFRYRSRNIGVSLSDNTDDVSSQVITKPTAGEIKENYESAAKEKHDISHMWMTLMTRLAGQGYSKMKDSSQDKVFKED